MISEDIAIIEMATPSRPGMKVSLHPGDEYLGSLEPQSLQVLVSEPKIVQTIHCRYPAYMLMLSSAQW